VATQGESKMRATTMVIFLARSDEPATLQSDTGRIRRIEAAGPVTVTQVDQVGTGDSGLYDKAENKVYLIGNVVSWGMFLIDLWLHLDFWHNWWDKLINVGLIYYLGIEGLTQTQPLRIHFVAQEDAPAQSGAVVRTEKTSEAELAHYQARIIALMENDRLYLDPELSLAELANRLDTNVSVLSAVINRAFGKNFNDFVNEYRVRAVQQYLQNGSASHLSLLGIALECGFNSKSTFNRAFRKMTGVAPSEWVGGERTVT
jgi:AraC-like DNA-binding protein